MEIITYWNGEELSYVLNAIASLMNSLDFNSILKIVAYLGVIIAFLMGVTGLMKQEDWPKYVGVMIVSIFVMTGPRETVTITDQSVSMPATVVGGVPMPLAWIASTTSGIGAYLTNAVETVFQVLPPLWSGNAPYPKEISFTGGGGPLFGHRIIEESGMLSISRPTLAQDMTSFYRECVIPDINTGYLDMGALAGTSSIWKFLGGQTPEGYTTNPARYVTIHKFDGTKWVYEDTAITCDTAYTKLDAYLTDETSKVLNQLGRRLNYKSSQAAAEALISGQLVAGYGAMLGISETAVDIVEQKMMTNFIKDANYEIPAMSGDAASTSIGLAQAQAEAQYASSSLTMRKVAEGILPKVRNVLEALIYALFPILVIYVIAAGNNALKPLGMYLKLAIWIQLWPMLYAILNFFITFGSAKAWQAETLGNGLAMQYSALVNAGAASDMAVAGMMVMSIPAIAWMLASGAVYAATQVATGMMQPASAAASSAGSQVAMGNNSMGNVSLRTANADKFDMSPNISAGTMTMQGSDGYKHKMSDLGSFTDGSFNLTSGLKTDISGSMQKLQSAQQSLSTAQKATQTAQESFNNAIASNAGTSYDFASNASNMQSFTKGMGKDESNEYAKGAQSYQSSVDSIAKSLGIDNSQAKQLMADAGFGWKSSWLPGLTANVNGSTQYSQAQKDAFNKATTGENGKKLDEAARWAEKVNQNSGWSDVAQHGNTAAKKIASGVLETRQRASALTAAKANETAAQQTYAQAVQTAVTANTNMNETAGIVGEKARQQWLRTHHGDHAGAELASQQAARDFLMAQGANPRDFMSAAPTIPNATLIAMQNPGSYIDGVHANNVSGVDGAGDPTALAGNAKALYEGEMGTAQAKVTAGMNKLDKDINGMKQRVDAFRASTGKDIDGNQTEALKAAEASGLISFDDKTGKYTVNNPSMDKNIDKAAKEVSDLTGGKVTPEQVKDVVGTLAAARTGGVLGGKAAKTVREALAKDGVVLGESAAKSLTTVPVVTGVAAGGAALGGSGGGNHNGSGSTTVLPNGSTLSWNGDVPVITPAQTTPAATTEVAAPAPPAEIRTETVTETTTTPATPLHTSKGRPEGRTAKVDAKPKVAKGDKPDVR